MHIKSFSAVLLAALSINCGVANAGSIIPSGGLLYAEQPLIDDSGFSGFKLDGIGNLVHYNILYGTVYWTSNSRNGIVLKMQEDRNLVLFNSGGFLPKNAVWNSGTAKDVWDAGVFLKVLPTTLLILTRENDVVWHTAHPKIATCDKKYSNEQKYPTCFQSHMPQRFNGQVVACSAAEAFSLVEAIGGGTIQGYCP